MELIILQLTDVLKISFRADEMSWIFAIMTTLVWLMAGIYSFEYMEHESHEKTFFMFYFMQIILQCRYTLQIPLITLRLQILQNAPCLLFLVESVSHEPLQST